MMIAVVATTITDAAAWVATHIPSRYDERLAGTTNTFTVRVTPNGCRIRIDVDSSNDFNQLRDPDRSKVYAVKGNPTTGHHFDASLGSGIIDFAAVDPDSLTVDPVDEYVASQEVDGDSFEFSFLKKDDAQQMLQQMTSLARACQQPS